MERSSSEGKPVQPEQPSPASSQWLEFLNLGWIFAGTLTVTVGGGAWLDHRNQTAPVFLLIGTLLGFLGCGYSLYRLVKKLSRNESVKPLK